MSWFDKNDVVGVEDAFPNDEIADGVILERRRVLMVSATAAGALLLGGAASTTKGVTRSSSDPLTIAQLLDRALPLSREVVKSSQANEQSYLFQLASLIAQLGDKSESPGKPMRAFRKANKVADEARFPLAAVQLRIKPGGRLRHHDHRDYNGVILGVKGTVRIKNYDILGDEPVPPQGKTFQIQETQDTLVTPGQYSMLARQRNNIHDLRAGPDGATVLDFFTFFDKASRSHWMDVDEEKPRDADAGIYDAAWRTRRRRR